MAAAEVIMACMIDSREDTKTAKTGGTSKPNPGGGGGDIGRTIPEGKTWPALTAGDLAGAIILTILFGGGFIAGVMFILHDETSDKTIKQQVRGFHSSAMGLFTGSGAAAGAAVLQKRNSQYNEKGRAGAAISERSSETSSDGMEITPAAPAVAFGHVRSISEPHRNQRRMSTMPLGWPHNPSLRASQVYEPSPSRPMSMQPTSSARFSRQEGAAQSGGLSSVASRPTSIQEAPQESRRRSINE